MEYRPLGSTEVKVPPIVFGTSALGNLYQALPEQSKLEIVAAMFQHVTAPVALDSAGKYGAGLALEVIGHSLRALQIPAQDVVISNKLGWRRVPLQGREPTFEPGAWVDLQHDAVQDIGYDGIFRCWEQGCHLLGEGYRPTVVSVHDPDEYLAQVTTEKDRRARWEHILDAYRALATLKAQGLAQAVGVGAKNWQVIRELSQEVGLDWVMLANSMTLYSHPPELLGFIEELRQRNIAVINSAVFNAGFLTGGVYFDYRRLDPASESDRAIFAWRERFFALCRRFHVRPAEACVQFGLSPPGVVSIALNTSRPERVEQNVSTVSVELPHAFWVALKAEGIIAEHYPYLG